MFRDIPLAVHIISQDQQKEMERLGWEKVALSDVVVRCEVKSVDTDDQELECLRNTAQEHDQLSSSWVERIRSALRCNKARVVILQESVQREKRPGGRKELRAIAFVMAHGQQPPAKPNA